LTSGLVGYEYWRYRESRAQLRASAHA